MLKAAHTIYPGQHNDFYHKDIWYIDEMGVEAPPYVPIKYLNFKYITQDWLCDLVKRFTLYQAPTKALYTLQQYLRSFTHFSRFLVMNFPKMEPKDINRAVMLGFIGYVRQLNQVNEARNKLITHVKQLITLAGVEEWGDVTREKIMYREDRLPVRRARPRFIPNVVLEQLQLHLSKLPTDIMNVVILLQHTGRRIGEICALHVDCLRRDEDGDYILLYYEFKMKKEETIPVNKQVVNVIKQQRKWLRTSYSGQESIYLFPASKQPTISVDRVRQGLKHLAQTYKIVGPDGNIWNFQPHQFRHTVGTKMINAGVPAAVVQKFLKHASPEMTMNYAHIFDSTMKAEFEKFQDNLVDITGNITNCQSSLPVDLKWLKHNILAQALPNGICALPVSIGSCPHSNACLTCCHFRTSNRFLAIHKEQLIETRKILTIAKENGWTRQVEINERIVTNLNIIVGALA